MVNSRGLLGDTKNEFDSVGRVVCISTNCVRSDKYERIHATAEPGTPKRFSKRVIRISWSMVSNGRTCRIVHVSHLAAGLMHEECHSARSLAQFLLNGRVCRPAGFGRVGRSNLHVRVDTVQHLSSIEKLGDKRKI